MNVEEMNSFTDFKEFFKRRKIRASQSKIGAPGKGARTVIHKRSHSLLHNTPENTCHHSRRWYARCLWGTPVYEVKEKP